MHCAPKINSNSLSTSRPVRTTVLRESRSVQVQSPGRRSLCNRSYTFGNERKGPLPIRGLIDLHCSKCSLKLCYQYAYIGTKCYSELTFSQGNQKGFKAILHHMKCKVCRGQSLAFTHNKTSWIIIGSRYQENTLYCMVRQQSY